MDRLAIVSLAAGVIAAAAAAFLWSGPADRADSDAAQPAAAADAGAGSVRGDSAPAAAGHAATLSAPSAQTPPGGASDAPPPGLSADQWAEVLAALQGDADAASERERLFAYFSWSDAVQRWRAAPQDPALATAVDTGLHERLARREVSAAEARQLKLALLATLEPDPALRMQALRDFDAALPAPAAPDPRELAYARQQTAVVAAWRAQPAAQRDPQALQGELAALRRQHFAPATASAPDESDPGR